MQEISQSSSSQQSVPASCLGAVLRADAALNTDLIVGAEAIAEFIYGDRRLRRRIYHHFEQGHLPLFRLGAVICGRKSILLRHIELQEVANLGERAW